MASAMIRKRLKSTSGCQRCREKRKKCDEIKPVCSLCSRHGLECYWRSSSDQQNVPTRQYPEKQDAPLQDTYLAFYDDPSLLQGSATSVIRRDDEKQAFLHLCEAGTTILRYPNQYLPGYSNLNPFRMSFQMASKSPAHLTALVALGAGHLSNLHPDYRKIAMRTYGQTMNSLRHEIAIITDGLPPEWVCVVASILSTYQLIMFDSAAVKLSHLLGFFRLCEARMACKVLWGPLQILFEHYIHTFTINTLFHSDRLVEEKDISYVSGLIEQLNRGSRPLGKEIVGVPEKLTIGAFKLSYLVMKDTKIAPWTMELMAVSRSIHRWEQAIHARKPSAHGLFIVAQLYWLACLCLLDYLEADHIDLTSSDDSRTNRYVKLATEGIQQSSLTDRPFNVVSWPIVILGIFAKIPEERMVLLKPLKALCDEAGLAGYRTAVNFLEEVWRRGLGPSVLRKRDILCQVHI